MSSPDESWPMIEEAVLRLFGEMAAKSPGEHVAIAEPLEELGWSDIEAEYPVAACELLFCAQGRSLAHTNCLDILMLAELASLLPEPVDGIVLPKPADGYHPGSDETRVDGIVLGPLTSEAPRRLAVPVTGPMGTVSLATVDSDTLSGAKMDTFDPSVCWTRVQGPLTAPLVDASTEWSRAIAAGHRGLATELIALADEALRIAVDHVSLRHQFGVPIGSFQSPRHLLAEAKANLEGARALAGETWRYGGRLSAQAAKAAAGRAHRAVSDAALQVCGAIGLTAEHDLHRYVSRGFQIDALCGSHQQLEGLLAERLFETYTPGRALPAIITCAD